MTIIAMTREMGTRGREVAAGVAERLGLSIIHHEIVEHDIAERTGMTEGTVHRFLEGEASLLERWKLPKPCDGRPPPFPSGGSTKSGWGLYPARFWQGSWEPRRSGKPTRQGCASSTHSARRPPGTQMPRASCLLNPEPSIYPCKANDRTEARVCQITIDKIPRMAFN